MPTQLKHIPPDFTINAIKGWNSRLLYTFYGNVSSGDFDYYAVAANYTDNLFSTIAAWETANGKIGSKGQYNYPQYSYFFKTGKSIRVKGYFLVSSDSDTGTKFNIRAKIENVTDASIYEIAAQDKTNDHTFARASVQSQVPVNFEITYSCVEDDSNLLRFQANGFYQYEYENYSGGGQNTSVVYVPIYASTQFTNVGTNDDEYNLFISFDNSSAISSIILRHLTVEELS